LRFPYFQLLHAKNIIEESSFNVAETETPALVEHPSLEFLEEFEVFAPAAAGVVPVAPCNPRNTGDPFDIEYRVEDRITEHSEDVQLKQSTLDETYNRRTGVERTNESVKDCGLGRTSDLDLI